MADEEDLNTAAWPPWPATARQDAPRVETQTGEAACGAACVVMLLRDRGLEVTQDQVAHDLTMPSPADELAERLMQLSALPWVGGSLPLGARLTWELLQFITAERGTWAALLEPPGRIRMGHWIVVDGVSQDGSVLVRDPAGLAYSMPLGAFAVRWRYTVLVMQEGAQ